jgi:hypothetical protein
MTHALLHQLGLGESEPLISASSFAESCSLEEFIDSFPTPSPARFQRSVHPSAVQQARVSNAEPLRTYIPMAGLDGLAITAIRCALSMDEDSVVLIGVEECGTWAIDVEAASDTAFAFAIRLSRAVSQNDSMGTISWDSDADGSETDCSLPTLFKHLHEHTPLHMSHPDMGSITLRWNN